MLPFLYTAAVQGVKVISLNSTAANISWNPLVIPDITVDYYSVVYTQNDSSQDGERHVMFNSLTTSGVITNLHSGSMYKFQGFAVVMLGDTKLEGERSAPVHVTCE